RHWEMEQWQGYPLKYHHHTDDMQPCYLPDGGICFISTRCEYGILCDDPDVFTTTVLYRMDADGKNMEKLTNSSVSESNPSVMHDGRILYTRWEYVDKGSVVAKCLWAMHPDGSGTVEIFGNDISYPPSFIQSRQIPNHNNLFVMLGAPHLQGCMGTVIRIDTNQDIRTRVPMTYITPNVDIRAEAGFHHKVNGRWVQDEDGPLFSDPYPLSRDVFLVSQNRDRFWCDIDAWDLYLIDSKGKKELIYDDPEFSCWMPMPLQPRKKPPILNTAQNPELAEKNLAVCIVTDIYKGLENVAPGTIKYIRVNEQMPRPWAARRYWDGDIYDQQHAVLTLETHLGLKVQYGIVPVHEDGSASFIVPADRNIFLQVLDENFMEVQRERTYINYRPGEVRSCIGCHEKPKDVPAATAKNLLALQSPPVIPGPQPGETTGARTLHYPTDIQPILDKHCISCHNDNAPETDLILTGEMTEYFSRSYEELLDRERNLMVVFSENGSEKQIADYLPAYSLGSHSSRLITMLREGHEDVKLPKEEMIKLITWVDSNAQYYGSYYGRRNIRYQNHPNFRPVPTLAQAISTSAPLPDDKR
ncbi:MAG: HzsA-related protein, partial [Planctomycetota bacterium]